MHAARRHNVHASRRERESVFQGSVSSVYNQLSDLLGCQIMRILPVGFSLFVAIVGLGCKDRTVPTSSANVPTNSAGNPPTSQTLTGGVIDTSLEAAPIPLSADVQAPIALHRVEPDFDTCIKQGVHGSGIPVVDATIDERGAVRDAHLAKPGHPCIDEAVLAAVKQWRFKPGTLHGKPVPVKYSITVLIHWK